MNLKTLCSAVLYAVIFSVVHASPTPDNLEKRAAQLEAMAEMMRATDPDFADWVKDQSSIYKSYKKAYLYDLKHDPYEAPWILDEWNALLSRMEKELEIYRAMPDLAAMGTADVHDFGAKADGKNDDAPAIQKAIDFAFKNGKGIVFLPKGTYFMKRGPGRTPALQFHKVKNLKLMGEDGTVLLMSSNKVPFFTVTSCENLRFENFHITASNPVFATGIITGYTEDGKGLLVKHDGGLTFDDQTIKECEMSNFRCYDGNLTEDGKTPLLYVRPLHKKSRTPFNFIHGKHVKDDIYSVYPPLRPNEKAADVFSSGLRLVNYARNHMGAFTMNNSDRCRIKKISFDRVGGLVVKVGQCDALFVTDCSVAAAGKEDFSFATCADFFFSRVPSLGGFVSRNIVRNLSDDLFNLHGTMVPILRQEGNTIYVLENYISGLPLSKNMPYIRSIDIVPDYKKPVLINAKTRYRVLSAEKVKIKHPSTYLDVNKTEGSNIVTVQKNISDVTAIKLVLDRDPGKLVCTDPFLNFKEYDKLRKIHPRKEFDLVHFPDLYGQGQVFSNNYFADSMGRAWVMGSGSVCRNNSFSLRTDAPFYCSWNCYMGGSGDEAMYPRVVTYEDNLIRLSEKNIFRLNEASYLPSDPSSWMRHIYLQKNIVVFDLTSIYYQLNGKYVHPPLFAAYGVADLELTDNTFLFPAKKGGPKLDLRDVKGRIRGNKYIGPWTQERIGENVELQAE